MKQIPIITFVLSLTMICSPARGQASGPTPGPTSSPTATPSPTPPPEPLIDQIKKCVVFLQGQYVRMQIQNEGNTSKQVPVLNQLSGTGFLIFVREPRLGADRGMNYLVTNRHMIRESGPNGVLGEGPYFGSIVARINTKKPLPGGTAFGTIPVTVVDATGSLEWFTDTKDENVDLAVTPIGLDPNTFEYKTLQDDLFGTEEVLKREHVSENDEILFAGLFARDPGAKKNYPIVRHGKLARLSEEPIPLDMQHPDKTVSVHLADVMSFGGNSGSPVFLRLGGVREAGSMIGGYSYYLLGVMQGYFPEGVDFTIMVSTLKGVAAQNSGIAAVIPADKIVEILNTPRALAFRDRLVAHKFEEEGNLEMAAKTIKDAVDVLEKAAPQHAEFGAALSDYGRILRKLKRLSEAEKADIQAKQISSSIGTDLMHPKM